MEIANLLRSFGPTSGGGGTPPPAPTLSIVDNEDGTGAVATISGGDSSATHTVYVAALDRLLGPASWISAGSRVGNGTVAISRGVGQYLAYVLAELDGESVSNPVYFRVTDDIAGESLMYRCLLADKARIEALTIDGLENDSIVIRKVPIDRNLGPNLNEDHLPAILLCPTGDQMDPRSGPVGINEYTVNILCVIVAADNQSLTANIDKFSSWREQIFDANMNRRLSGVRECVNGWVEPREIVNQESWKQNLFSSGLVLRRTCWKTRS